MKYLLLLLCLYSLPTAEWQRWTSLTKIEFLYQLANDYGQKNHCSRVKMIWQENGDFIDFDATCETDI